MRRRCDDPGHKDYALYGGRGIDYVRQWRAFEPFLADMGPRPESTTLDRIDSEGNYEPGNCRWADAVTQRANVRYEPRGYHLRKPRAKVIYGTKTIECRGGCGRVGTVKTVVWRWFCPPCRAASIREKTARWRERHPEANRQSWQLQNEKRRATHSG